MAKRPNLQAFFLPCLQRMESRSPTAELSLAQASRPVRRSSKSEGRKRAGVACREKNQKFDERTDENDDFVLHPIPCAGHITAPKKFSKIDEQTIGGDNFTSASTTCRCSISAEQAPDLRV